MNKGRLFIISAPSGAGKTSLVRALASAMPNIYISVSHTTRAKRPNEQEGVHYYYVGESKFEHLIEQDAFLEHAYVFGHYYGTAKTSVTQHLDAGQNVILEIDWQGAQQVRKRMPGAISIFILPPSLTTLKERLVSRGQDALEVIQKRLLAAQQEISHYHEFDFLIVNDQFDEAQKQLQAIISASLNKADHAEQAYAEILQDLLKKA